MSPKIALLIALIGVTISVVESTCADLVMPGMWTVATPNNPPTPQPFGTYGWEDCQDKCGYYVPSGVIMWTYQISVDHCYCLRQPYGPGISGHFSTDWYSGYFPNDSCSFELHTQKLNSAVIGVITKPLTLCGIFCHVYGSTIYWTWNSGNAQCFCLSDAWAADALNFDTAWWFGLYNF